jgi:ATP-dependent helicase/nuclease subunit A
VSARSIPEAVRRRQAEASDPSCSVFVAANAGSGKTHVLAQRVIRLMLDGAPGGVDPSRILCITFTKAAAANMAARVFDRLRSWIALDDAALDAALADIGVRGVDAGKRARARALFAAALETPGGLKVQTIHAFCTRLLQQFPFEANVAARFTVLDDRSQNEMFDRAIMAVLLQAAGAPESKLGRALRHAVTGAADSTVRAKLQEAIGKRETLARWLEAAGSLEQAVAQLSRALDVDPSDDLDVIHKEIIDGPNLPSAEWAAVAATFAEGSSNDRDQVARLAEALAASDASSRADAYLGVFFKDDGDPRKSAITGPLARKYPSLDVRLAAEKARLEALVARRRAVVCRDRTAALVTLAREVIARYGTEKDRRGLLDYDDLIDKAGAMLDRVDSSWVHYKLDLGLDHVLIDEAQDTSEKQWRIVRRLVAEFAAGAGARGSLARTLFAVGDEKQSIFSFQGAAPRQYEEMRRHFAALFSVSEIGWRHVRFDYSFRSGPNVLGAVDTVFASPAIHRSITSDEAGMPAHLPLPAAVAGDVEVWPIVEPEAKAEIEAWDAPFDAMPESSPRAKLAAKIASTVRSWIADGTPVGDKRRPLTPGDVLVLVRQRGPLFEAIIRGLKNAGVAVAGADRLKLTEHIAIIDLMALADALLLPQDDLALATALKSPLFDFDDDFLFALAWNRPASVREALAARAGERQEFAVADALLTRCARMARETTPFAFFAWLLGPEGGRRRIFARLGIEAADALEEFLELALAYERQEPPSLQGFLAWLRSADATVKRDMEIERDEVRVMTVHGAKGLEAPVVILADTTTPPAGPPGPAPLMTMPQVRAAPGAPPCLIWPGRKEDDVAAVAMARAQVRQEAEDEHRRLLYVAMTRAAERLIVCGYQGVKRRPEGCWYDLVTNGLAASPDFAEIGAGDTRIWQYRTVPPDADIPGAPPSERSTPPDIPAWLATRVSTEPPRTVTLTPSTAYEETVAPRRHASAGQDARRALERGRLVHRLLQSLPEVPAAERPAAAARYIERAGAAFTRDEHAAAALAADERHRLVSAVLGILDDVRFAPLFAAGSRAEVPIVGRLPRTGQPDILVSGQIDRLVITADAVLIADYKTNQFVPATPKAAPPAYVEQLALYRAVLTRIYPGRTVRAALVWTEGPALMEFSGVLLDAAMVRVTSA